MSLKHLTLQEEAESVFTNLIDPKTKQFTEQTKSVCSNLKIEVESLLPGYLQQFYAKLKDKDIAKIHLKFYQKKRIKNIIAVNKCIQDSLKPPLPPR